MRNNFRRYTGITLLIGVFALLIIENARMAEVSGSSALTSIVKNGVRTTSENQVPTASSDSYSVNEDTTLTVSAPGVISNDSDPEGNPLTAAVVKTPSLGGLNFNSNGSFTYRGIQHRYGTDTFTYKVNDGTSDSNVATVTITMNPVNDVPVAVNDYYDTRPNTPLVVPSLGVLQNDTDVESPLTTILITNPAHGTLMLNSTGGFTYTPGTNFTGTDTFTYKANDGTADSSVATVYILVNTPVQRTVTKIEDTNDGVCNSDCSLREAIATANAGDEIVFASPLFDTAQTIMLSHAANFKTLVVNKSLKITGKGANLLNVRRGTSDNSLNGAFRIFNVTGSGVLATITGMTISNGHSYLYDGAGIHNNSGSTLTVLGCYITGNNAYGLGGGIFNASDSTLTVVGSTISNNSSGSHSYIINSPNGRSGGGIDNRGILTVVNSTVSGNSKGNSNQYSTNNGGGIYTSGTTLISGSTVTQNQAVDGTSAGGVYNDGATVTIRNSIIAVNWSGNVQDVAGTAFTSEGYNLIGNVGAITDFNQTGDQTGDSQAPLAPQIYALASNNGTTPTHALAPTSPALDKGKSFGSATDQRGQRRPSDNNQISPATDGDDSDIGSYEAPFPLSVTKTEDTNDGVCNSDCSLREALAAAAAGDEIVFSSLFDSPQIITLKDEANFRDLIINKNVTISGKGAHLITIRRTSGAFRIFTVASGLTAVKLNGLTIEGGSLQDNGGGILNGNSTTTVTDCHITGNAAGAGGGIRNEIGGTLAIVNSTISNNVSDGSGETSGGIDNRGTLALVNSTVSGNSASAGNNNGGGIWTSGAVTITNSTVSDNEAAGKTSAGGIFRQSGTVTVRNTIIAANRNNYELPDVAGELQSGGYNIVGNQGATTAFNQTGDQTGEIEEYEGEIYIYPLEPELEALALNGGTTPTHALLLDSPAIDKGKSFGSATDQRGQMRPFDRPNLPSAIGGDHADIGAFEAQLIPNAAPQVSATPNPITTNENTSKQFRIYASDENADTLTVTLVDQPDHGTISDFDPTPDCEIRYNTSSCDQSITYTPNPNFVGLDSFSFKANDGQLDSEIETINFVVQDVSQVFTVTKTADTNDGVCNADCSLREAIAAAASGDEVRFASPLFDSPQTITLSEAEGFRQLAIAKNLTITGKGANLLTIRPAPDAQVYFSIFSIENNLNVSLSGMKITGAKAISGSAIFNGNAGATSGSLTVSNCNITGNYALYTGAGITSFSPHTSVSLQNTTISNNTAEGINIIFGNTPSGGGLHINGALTVVNSTISGNVKNHSDTKGGGGIYSDGGNTVDITSSTITDNQAVGSSIASGVFKNSGAASVRNTIIAGNRSNTNAPDVAVGDSGVFASSGYNLIGNPGAVTAFSQTGDQTGNSQTPLDPRLDPLGNYGGETPTHRLQSLPVLSPAIDKGKAFGVTVDQRGNMRPFDSNQISPATGGDNTDIGAYEKSEGSPLFVTKTADTDDGVCDADCSLREAITAASSGDTIVFDPSVFSTPQIITLSDAAGFRELIINKSLIISGTGAQFLTVRRAPAATANFRIFSVSGNITVNLSGMTIAGGNASEAPGGGIFNVGGSQLSVTNSHIAGNNALYGGGIFNDNISSVSLLGSTVSGNTADCVCGGGAGINNDGVLTVTSSTVSSNVKTNGDGNAAGGIYNYSGEANFTNSTITDNKAPGTNSAGGIFRAGGTVTVSGTIIAANRTNTTEPDVAGVFTSNGYNLIGNVGLATGFNQTVDQKGNSSAVIDPKLSALGNYGGATPTHKLLGGSPAIDAGNSFGTPTDQRGSVRPFDNTNIANASDGSDIGAYEQHPGEMLSIAGTITYGTTPSGQATKYLAGVTITASGASNVSVVTNASGVYSLDNLNADGNYTVTPSKTGNVNGIDAFDATLVLRCVAAGNNCTLTDNQKFAADADADNTVSAFDATQILRFVAANGTNANTGNVGKWKFSPAPRQYAPLNDSFAGEDYTALLIGEISGDWAAPNN